MIYKIEGSDYETSKSLDYLLVVSLKDKEVKIVRHVDANKPDAFANAKKLAEEKSTN